MAFAISAAERVAPLPVLDSSESVPTSASSEEEFVLSFLGSICNNVGYFRREVRDITSGHVPNTSFASILFSSRYLELISRAVMLEGAHSRNTPNQAAQIRAFGTTSSIHVRFPFKKRILETIHAAQVEVGEAINGDDWSDQITIDNPAPVVRVYANPFEVSYSSILSPGLPLENIGVSGIDWHQAVDLTSTVLSGALNRPWSIQ